MNKNIKSYRIIFIVIIFIVINFTVFTAYNDKVFGRCEVCNVVSLENECTMENEFDDPIIINSEDILNEDVENIAVFGVDSARLDAPSRSDSILIVSINKNNNFIKLSSIMRDTYVKIDGFGYDKINHAYAYGGPELALKTINNNFGLDIKKYVTINYFGVKNIVDSLGGVEIEVKDEEVNMLNSITVNTAKHYGMEPEYLDSPGLKSLTGLQAVGYSRIRYVGNGDFERTDRQRRVLKSLYKKIKTLKVTEYPGLIKNTLPLIQTNLSLGEIHSLTKRIIFVESIDEKRFPEDDYCFGKQINGVYYLTIDEETTKNHIHDFIFN